MFDSIHNWKHDKKDAKYSVNSSYIHIKHKSCDIVDIFSNIREIHVLHVTCFHVHVFADILEKNG